MNPMTTPKREEPPFVSEGMIRELARKRRQWAEQQSDIMSCADDAVAYEQGMRAMQALYNPELAFVRENAAAWEKSCKEAYEAQERLSKRDDEQTAEISRLRTEQEGPKWISVKERLPVEPEEDGGENVLILTVWGAHYVARKDWQQGHNPHHWWCEGNIRLEMEDVTHWMPLPDPPAL